jgi:hypothetical protein
MGLCVLPSAASAVVAWPGTSIPERVAETDKSEPLYDQVNLHCQWRREYERSIDRLIRTVHPSGPRKGQVNYWSKARRATGYQLYAEGHASFSDQNY